GDRQNSGEPEDRRACQDHGGGEAERSENRGRHGHGDLLGRRAARPEEYPEDREKQRQARYKDECDGGHHDPRDRDRYPELAGERHDRDKPRGEERTDDLETGEQRHREDGKGGAQGEERPAERLSIGRQERDDRALLGL